MVHKFTMNYTPFSCKISVITIFKKPGFWISSKNHFPFISKTVWWWTPSLSHHHTQSALRRKVNPPFLFSSCCIPTCTAKLWAGFFETSSVNLAAALKHVIFLFLPSKTCHWSSSSCFRGKKIFLGETVSNQRK